MNNREIQAAWRYHEGTKHPGGFLMNPEHHFDPAKRPLLFKRYLGLEAIPLPLDKSSAGAPALEAISNSSPWTGEVRTPELGIFARLLYFSAGVTKRIIYPSWGEFLFRAAACTGALYHIELYLVCGDLPGLEAGIYHFDPSGLALERLRRGDYRRILVEASAGEPALSQASAILVYTDVFWRNAVKYQAREYRHAFWDSGTILSHTLAMATAHQLPTKLVTGFVDTEVNRLLGLDTQKEVSLALVAVGSNPEGASGAFPEASPLSLETMPVSSWEIGFPAIHEMHQASSLASRQEVKDWRKATEKLPPIIAPAPEAPLIPLQPLSREEMPRDTIEEVILRRGSTRRFARKPISFQQLSTILEQSIGPLPADFLGPHGQSLNQAYLIVHAVEDLDSGAYVYHLEEKVLERLKAGEFRREAGSLALGQDLAADASANIYFLASLPLILERLGNRGYRAAQLEASITAGKIYLASYAQRLGASGLTFYDDAVTRFFSPHGENKSVMFLVAVGMKARRRES